MVERTLYYGCQKMQVANLFRSDVFVQNIGTVEQRQQLKLQALAAMNKYPAIKNTNAGCWRGNVEYTDADWLTSAVESTTGAVCNFYLDNDPAYRNRFAVNGPITRESWTNINNPGSKNILHSHKSFDFVCVYYLQSNGTGDIVFHNPANLLTDCSLNSPGIARLAFTPKDGDLFMWPAWVPHEIETNDSQQQRINIAFNIKL